MGLALLIIGLIVWLALGYQLLGVILIIIGLVLLLVPNTYGPRDWGGRRGRV